MSNHKIHFLYDFVFPNMFLPNAIITEYGIVNYLSSLHASKATIHQPNILEKLHGLKDQSIGGILYENAFGRQPNTHTGSHMSSHVYSKYFEYTEGSLFEWQQKIKKYIYPIGMTPYVNDFTGVSAIGSKLNGEYFWKHMSTLALTDAQQGKAIIFIDYAQENFIEKSAYCKLHESLEKSGIPKNNIILAFNSFNATEVYESWFSEEEQMLQVRNWPFSMTYTSHHYKMNPSQRMSITEFLETRNTIRNKHFIFKIRRTRDYRLAFLYKIATDDLLEKANWSCLTPVEFNENNVLAMQDKYNFELNSTKVEQLCNLIPHSLDGETGSTYETVGTWTDQTFCSPLAHKNAYLYLCSETFIDGEYKSLTEKIFKPIINFQPFLFIAYPGALALLHKLGFKTFAPLIDESYDNELNDVKRLNMIYAELNRICNMRKEEIHAWYWSMEEILIYNYNHFLNIWQDESHTGNLLSYLLMRTKL